MIVYLLIWFIKQQTKYGYSMLALTNMIREVLMERLCLLDILKGNEKPLIDQDIGQLDLVFAISKLPDSSVPSGILTKNIRYKIFVRPDD